MTPGEVHKWHQQVAWTHLQDCMNARPIMTEGDGLTFGLALQPLRLRSERRIDLNEARLDVQPTMLAGYLSSTQLGVSWKGYVQ